MRLCRHTSIRNRVGAIDRFVCFLCGKVNMCSYLSDSWFVGKRITRVDEADGSRRGIVITTFL